MKKILFVISLVTSITISCISQNKLPMNTYEKEWQEIEQLQKKGLPQTLLPKVEAIYQAALAENNYEQMIKAIIYQINGMGILEENDEGANKIFNTLKQDAAKVPQPAKSIIYSLTGQMYGDYYTQNAWTINQRTNTTTEPDDIHTWDSRRLAEEAVRYYELSLHDPAILQNEPIGRYKDILRGEYPLTYQPTLYDLLANRALTFYTSAFSTYTLPQQTFVMNDPAYFANADAFSRIHIEPVDSLSPSYLALRTYQRLLQFHLEKSKHSVSNSKVNEDIAVLIDVDLRRLAYVKEQGAYSNNDALYEEALIHTGKAYKAYHDNARVLLELGGFYLRKGDKWRTDKQEDTKDGYVKAYDICRQLEKEYPNQLSSNVEALKKQIEYKEIEVTFETVQLPDEPFLALLKFRNTEMLYQTIYPLSPEEALDYMHKIRQQTDGNNDKLTDFINKLKTDPLQEQIKLPAQTDFQYYTTEMKMNPLKKGFYLILMSDSDKGIQSSEVYTTSLLQVSSLATQDRTVDHVMSVMVTDRKTGKPVSGATVTAYQEMKAQASFSSDNTGIAKSDKLPDYNYNRYYRVTYKDDMLYMFNPGYDRYISHPQSRDYAVILTDRAIYRPGQTVYFKAILYTDAANGEKTLLDRKTVSVRLKDVNRQTISEQSLTTNEFGSIDGNFSIPQGLLNGQMTIECPDYGTVVIQVEEYKRPTFEVIFDPVKGNFSFNENVTVTAKATALAGYAIDKANVQYRVVREMRYRYYNWWYPPIRDNIREISSGFLQTDEKGNVTITFKALADDIKDDEKIYTYMVTADITDVNGETRSGTVNVQIGTNPLLVNTNVPDKILPGKSTGYTVETTNLNGDFTPASVQVDILSLKAPDKILRKRVWSDKIDFPLLTENEFHRYFPVDEYGDELNPDSFEEIKTVATYAINTDKTNQLDLSSLKTPGYYKIRLTAKSNEGVVAENVRYVYQLTEDPGTIANMDEWLTVIKNTGEPGEQVEFRIGGSENSAVYCELIHNDHVIESNWINVGTTPTKVTYPIKELYRGGFIVQFSMIRQNRMYTHIQPVNVPYTNKMLDVKLSTFRDKLLPGENETWTMRITNKKGEKEIAEVAASLYDASLDIFRPHTWDELNAIYSQYVNTYMYSWGHENIETLSLSNIYRNSLLSPWQYTTGYADINFYDETYRNAFYPHSGAYGSPMLRSAVRYKQQDIAEIDGIQLESAVISKDEIENTAVLPAGKVNGQPADNAAMLSGSQEATPVDLTAVDVRTNFNETAFFYPKLRTDKEGELRIEFTMPEALTRWKLLSFAHTKDFKTGTYTNELITQKQVAVSINAPRFLRENDVIELTAKVNNLTASALNGQALLRLYDATTMLPVDTLIQSEKTTSFSVNAGESTGIRWILSIPKGIQAVTYQVTAQAGTHTDGEEKTIPVLTNSMLVTETLPFSVRAGQEKEFMFDKLINHTSKTLRNYSLTLEFTSAPAWYAVQSLPYIMEYPYECSEQTFSRYYANTLAATITNKTPRIRQIFDQWNTADSEALISNIEKNQELKQVILEETPWVVQAKNETERKKRIGLLFDLNRLSNEMNRAFMKLKNVQNGDGGFPWFQGNPSNRYITQYIVAGMAHLEKLGAMQAAHSGDAAPIVQRGLSYLDKQIEEDYNELIQSKSDMKKQHISAIQLHYLYACSFGKHIPGGKQKEAFDYYLSQAGQFWMSFSTYEKAMAALVLHRNHQTDKAITIIRSLQEYAQQSAEMGMYWKDNVAGYFWHQAPIETQAMLIEAFNEVTNDKASVEEMKIWLLRNKQTNDWKTTKATSEAIYALLMTGGSLLDESKPIEVELAGKPITEIANEAIRPEAGTGYVKTSWQGSDITPSMGKLNVTNPNQQGIAWGGMYWQYFGQLDKITSAETNLKMNKQLFLRTLTAHGEELQPIREKNKLKVGDLVRIRMELRADRDYEYVHLKDMRASGFEPVRTLSGYRYQDGLWYYESIKDASINYFITYLRKGTYVFEYDLRVSHAGDFSNGITTFQCMYAPEFSAHSEGIRVTVEE